MFNFLRRKKDKYTLHDEERIVHSIGRFSSYMKKIKSALYFIFEPIVLIPAGIICLFIGYMYIQFKSFFGDNSR